MAKKQPQPMDLNLMHPTPEQRIPAPRVEVGPAAQSMPERAARFGSLVHGFVGGATKLIED